MSITYSTGQLAEETGISVRTVQFYDHKKLLVPSTRSDGDRRQYTEKDLEKLRMILFLKELGFSLKQIREFLTSDNDLATIRLLLTIKIEENKREQKQIKERLHQLESLSRQIKSKNDFRKGNLIIMKKRLNNQKAWQRHTFWYSILLAVVIVIYTVSLSFFKLTISSALPVAILFIGMIFGLSYWYYRGLEYLCPVCHQTFQPTYWEFAKARHTPKTRKLTCPHCHTKSSCLELAKEESLKR